jgi:hypothetical protein
VSSERRKRDLGDGLGSRRSSGGPPDGAVERKRLVVERLQLLLLGLRLVGGVVEDRRLHDDVQELLRAHDEQSVDGDLHETVFVNIQQHHTTGV